VRSNTLTRTAGKASKPPTMSTVLHELIGKVSVVTLNRPDARNALSPELLVELRRTLSEVEQDPKSVAVVLTGAGEKAFCAGADLSKSFGSDAGFLAMHEGRAEIAELFRQLSRLKKPVIGAANGAALAGGMGVIMSCDLIVAAERATFGLPEVKRGLMPYMVMAVLVRQIGRKRALEMVLGGESISATYAEQIGLINKVLPNDGFLDAAVQYAAKIATYSPAILRLGKQSFYTQADMSFDQALAYLHGQLTLNTLTEDAMEGIQAFFQKREPQWSGK
jgi:enoyl-CoA hydratase